MTARRDASRTTIMGPAFALALSTLASPASAATGDGAAGWLPWIVLGAIGLFVIGVALRTLFAARFPRGYGKWALSRRGEFAERNAQWDRNDDDSRQ